MLLALDQKNALFQRGYRLSQPIARQHFDERLRLSWVYHDHALEGVVLTENELQRGIAGEQGKDYCENNLLCDVHRLYSAIPIVRREARIQRELDLDFIKYLHVLAVASDNPAAGRYRKSEQPPGAYLHEWAQVRSISYRMRKLMSFITDEAPQMHPVRAAAHLHSHAMRVMPFERRSGTVGRMLLNFWLLREGYPAVVIPAHARAEYYTALRDGTAEMTQLLSWSLEQTLDKGIHMVKPVTRRSSAEL